MKRFVYPLTWVCLLFGIFVVFPLYIDRVTSDLTDWWAWFVLIAWAGIVYIEWKSILRYKDEQRDT